MIYFHFLLSMIKTEKNNQSQNKKNPQSQMKLNGYKDYIYSVPHTLGRH